VTGSVSQKLFKVSLLEELGLTHAAAVNAVAPDSSLTAPHQALRDSWRRWRDEGFVNDVRVMNLEMGWQFMRELGKPEPPTEPCRCERESREHAHCGVCDVPVAFTSGPQLLDHTWLGHVCSKLACFNEAMRRHAPDVHAARALKAAHVAAFSKVDDVAAGARLADDAGRVDRCEEAACAADRERAAGGSAGAESAIGGRPIADLSFGNGLAGDHQRVVDGAVRAILRRCGAAVAADIETLGCTGLAHHGISMSAARFLRDGLAGSGIVLTCWVSTDRFCHVHEAMGVQRVGDPVPFGLHLEEVSRPLASQDLLRTGLQIVRPK
jgi:hypothetical protein